MSELINHIDNYFSEVNHALASINKGIIIQFINLLLEPDIGSRRIYLLGNGGSSTTASHFCCDLMNLKRKHPDFAFTPVCLTSNSAVITAAANDCGYDNVFTEQLKILLNKDDAVVAISGSGNSRNVLNAVQYANSMSAVTIALTGFDGGELIKIAGIVLHVASTKMKIVEDCHITLLHCIVDMLFSGYQQHPVNHSRLTQIGN